MITELNSNVISGVDVYPAQYLYPEPASSKRLQAEQDARGYDLCAQYAHGAYRVTCVTKAHQKRLEAGYWKRRGGVSSFFGSVRLGS